MEDENVCGGAEQDENGCGGTEQQAFRMDLKIPFPNQKYAEIAYNSLRVDPEPKRGGCKKILEVDDNVLHVVLRATEARTLRVASNSFLDLLILVTQTIEQFGDINSDCS